MDSSPDSRALWRPLWVSCQKISVYKCSKRNYLILIAPTALCDFFPCYGWSLIIELHFADISGILCLSVLSSPPGATAQPVFWMVSHFLSLCCLGYSGELHPKSIHPSSQALSSTCFVGHACEQPYHFCGRRGERKPHNENNHCVLHWWSENINNTSLWSTSSHAFSQLMYTVQ